MGGMEHHSRHKKVVGPVTVLEFVGIILDTVKGEMRLSDEKIQALKELIQKGHTRKACTKRELLSLIGKLAHACKVVRPGRLFLRRMIETATKARQLEHWIRLNEQFRSDLAWWKAFLGMWNGRGFMKVNWKWGKT